MEILYNNIKYTTVIQIGQDARGNRRQIIEGGVKTVTIASKGIREQTMAMNRELVRELFHQNTLTIQRGYDSIDSHVMVPRALLERIPDMKQLGGQDDEEDC